ncbi:MAG TPA: hypothetical protein OIM48_06790 [Clostridiaceae bacterium]|jgi:hypothetical protein|nr:hypothetical protein [Clostridium sp.]MEE0127056.1 hypothetical protein [Clostridia bacterium]HJJ12984.1 hypothetical protein [Clostridiaceae bacterium]
MEYYLEDEPMVKEYREQRKQLEETIDLFNSYIRKATYELALNDGSKELIKVLQAELKITLEDEMQIYLHFKEEPEEVFSYGFMTWCETLEKELKLSKPEVPENMEEEIGKIILKITQLYFNLFPN